MKHLIGCTLWALAFTAFAQNQEVNAVVLSGGTCAKTELYVQIRWIDNPANKMISYVQDPRSNSLCVQSELTTLPIAGTKLVLLNRDQRLFAGRLSQKSP